MGPELKYWIAPVRCDDLESLTLILKYGFSRALKWFKTQSEIGLFFGGILIEFGLEMLETINTILQHCMRFIFVVEEFLTNRELGKPKNLDQFIHNK